MNEDRLWAPWRLDYVTGADASNSEPLPEPLAWQADADPNCFLCRDAATYDQSAVPSTSVDRRLLVIDRGPSTIVVLNRFPYNNGHLLVAPRRHAGDLADLTNDELVECQRQLVRFERLYRRLIKAEGFNIGLNLGPVAGAGLPGHVHWHLVPRWRGDTNFMPVLAGARVIPQSLDSLWEMLTAALDDDES